MGNSIVHWQTLKCEGLEVPFSALRGLNKRYRGESEIVVDLKCESGYMVGKEWVDKVPNPRVDVFKVQEIHVSGVGSQHTFYELLIPMLKLSRGTFDALAYWEDDGIISRLQALDGAVTDETVSVPMLIRLNEKLQTLLNEAITSQPPPPLVMLADVETMQHTRATFKESDISAAHADLKAKLVYLVEHGDTPNDICESLVEIVKGFTNEQT